MSHAGDLFRRLARLLPRAAVTRAVRAAATLETPQEKLRAGTLTQRGTLENMRRNGFRPGSIIDAGAHVGAWTRAVRELYPDVPVLMIEASPDKEAVLARTAAALPGVHHRIALLGATSGPRVPFHVVPTRGGSGTGSSVLAEKTGFARDTVQLPLTALDELVAELALPPPYLLKLDVQGYELEVLRGAPRTLAATEAVLTEVSLLQYNEGAPLVAQVIAELDRQGLRLYDVCGQSRRQSDDTLFQLDLVLVREDSVLRRPRKFWNQQAE